MRTVVGAAVDAGIPSFRAKLLAGVSLAALVLAASPDLARAADFDLNGTNLDLTATPNAQLGGPGLSTGLVGPDGVINNGVNANAVLTEGAAGTYTYAATIKDGTSTTALIHTNGTIVLTNTNTYTGGTTGMPSARAATTSGLSACTALEVTSTSAPMQCAALCPTAVRRPRALSRRKVDAQIRQKCREPRARSGHWRPHQHRATHP